MSEPTSNDSPSTIGGMSRRQQIVRLLLRYRHSGVFSGISLDGEIPRLGKAPTAGDPTQFVSDLEALGTTFVKLGQVLSTRRDLLPPDMAEEVLTERGETILRLYVLPPDGAPVGVLLPLDAQGALSHFHWPDLRDQDGFAVQVVQDGKRLFAAGLAGQSQPAQRDRGI